MTRYHSTPEGRVQFTAEEETQFDQMTSDYLAGADDRAAAQNRSDVTMADNWKTYRQGLRDLPTNSNWPNLEDSDWPTKP